MHDTHKKHLGHHHQHQEEHSHEHEAAKSTDEHLETRRLRKMVEHWIGHNEDHASSYRLWAGRARDMGFREPGEILDQIASEFIEQNKKLAKITQIIDSSQ